MSELIEKLKTTVKWRHFEQWYNENYNKYGGVAFEDWYCKGDPKIGFLSMDLCFQKGIFEKYITSTSNLLIHIITSSLAVHSITVQAEQKDLRFYSYDEFLIWYFNEHSSN